jgi:hypothetical protein
MAEIEYIEDITPFSWPLQKLPRELGDAYREFIFQSGDRLFSVQPKSRVDAIVASPIRRWNAEANAITLYTFARFRWAYSLIDALARVLAPVYLEIDVLPVIRPMPTACAPFMPDFNPRMYRAIRHNGLLLYAAT